MFNTSSDEPEHLEYEDGDFEVEFSSDIEHLLPDPGAGILLIDPADLDTAIGAWDQDTATTSSEEAARINGSRRLREQPGRLMRQQLFGHEAMLDRLAVLKRVTPTFAEVTDLVARSAQVSMTTGSPLLLPPILLLGEPGIGKSYYAGRLAEAIGTDVHRVAGTTLSDRGSITGLSPVWRGARPGCVAKALLASRSASPVVVFDEADKAADWGYGNARVPDALLTLLEPETARKFEDDYLGVPMRADGVVWILAANDVSSLSEPLLDRVITIQVPQLSADQRDAVCIAIYDSINAVHGLVYDRLSSAVLRCIAGLNHRRVRRVLTLGLGFAAAAGRRHLVPADIAASRRLVEGEPRTPAGFRMSPRADPR